MNPDWNYLQFKEGVWDSIAIKTDGHLQILVGTEDDSYWYSNGEQCDLAIGGQRCMYYKGTGKVLTTLGMGILPLLLATKDATDGTSLIMIAKFAAIYSLTLTGSQ